MKLEIPVEFEVPRSIVIEDDTSLRETLVQSALPPLLLHVILPPSYPLHSPPEIVSLRATHMWIPDIQVLQTVLINMWRIGEQVLYNWVEYIRTGEFLQAIELTKDSVIVCVSPHYFEPINQLFLLGFLIQHLSFSLRYFWDMNYHQDLHNSLGVHIHVPSVLLSLKDPDVCSCHASISFVGLV